jgi:hypothetical protein
MNELKKIIGSNGRRLFRVAFGFKDTFEATYDNSEYHGQAASDLILAGLKSESPFAASRFGYSELRALLTYLHINEKSPDWKKLFSFAKGDKVEPWWNENTIMKITHNAGVFPKKIEVIEKFCELVQDDMSEIDVLGSWLGGERWIKPMMPNTKFMRFYDFYHFVHENPWTEALKGKKVLVVHPFTKSIESQYKVKDHIFKGVHVLPDFELITCKAVQSIAGNKPSGFNDWFEALEKMKSDIANVDFDISIIACGAYGMPLAAFIKRDLGKKAIHLGGNAQILFGIKGSRWEGDPKFNHIFNSYWVKPLPEETPLGHQTIDSNCYW